MAGAYEMTNLEELKVAAEADNISIADGLEMGKLDGYGDTTLALLAEREKLLKIVEAAEPISAYPPAEKLRNALKEWRTK